MRVFIIRHGESTNNRLDSSLGKEEYLKQRSHDPSLTELGFRQAEAVAEHLATAQVAEHFGDVRKASTRGYGISRLYCSPMLRALQTTWPISRALGLNPEVWIDIHEHGGLFTGDPLKPESIRPFNGMTQTEINEQFPDYRLPREVTDKGWYFAGYEDMPACYARAIRVAQQFDEMARAHRSGYLPESDDSAGELRIAVVAHATFIDALIKAICNQLPSPGFHYAIYNTAITRIDYRESGVVVRYVNRTEHFAPDVFGELAQAAQHTPEDVKLPGF